MATGQRGHRARGTQAALILALLGAAAFLNGYIAETHAQPSPPVYLPGLIGETFQQQLDDQRWNQQAQQTYNHDVSSYLEQQRSQMNRAGWGHDYGGRW